jgi:putative transposase
MRLKVRSEGRIESPTHHRPWNIVDDRVAYGFSPMTVRKRTTVEAVTAFRAVHALVERGGRVADAVRTAGITEVTYYRWRHLYDGLTDDQVSKFATLQAENFRLRRKVAELQLEKRILQAAAAELLSTPLRRRALVDRITAELPISERRACQVLGQNRSTQRKIPKLQPRPRNEDAVQTYS